MRCNIKLAIRLIRRNLALIVAAGLMAGFQLAAPTNATAFHCPYGDRCKEIYGDENENGCLYSHCNMYWDDGPTVNCVYACEPD